MKITTPLLLMLMGVNLAISQKIVKKQLILPHVEVVQVDAEQFAEVWLETVPEDELRLEATMEGEYQRDIAIEITESGNTIHISGSFQPFFETPNDKLSAHKVVAVTLHVQLPEGLLVGLYGMSSRVVAAGIYRKLEIIVGDGLCSLDHPEGDIRVTTQSGDILLKTNKGRVDAGTRYGQVEMMEIPPGINQYILKSVHGNIQVSKDR